MAARPALLYICLVACGGGGNSSQPDAPRSDGGSATCDAAATYAMSMLAAADQSASESGSGLTGDDSHYLEYIGKLDDNAMPTELVIELAANIGTFAGSDFGPKSITLAGAETDYKTCGACVRVLAQVDTTAMTAAQDYMATAGTLDLTQTEGSFAATLTGVTLTHVTIGSDFDSIPIGDCNISIPSLAIAAPIEQAALR